MRQRWIVPAALLTVALAVQPVLTHAQATCPPGPTAEPLSFAAPQFIDTQRAGGEPVSIVANDGSIIVAAHAGTTHYWRGGDPDPNWVATYGNQEQLWRSTDDGAHWHFVSVGDTGVPMHSPTSTGFSDPTFAKDTAGTIYGAEIDLANISVFSSNDNGSSWLFANPLAASGDRPWLAARGPNEIYLDYDIPGNYLKKSTDGGLTWTDLPNTDFGGTPLYISPVDPKGLIATDGPDIWVSHDDGQSFQSYDSGISTSAVISSGAVDNAGYAYAIGASNGVVEYRALNTTTGEWVTDEPVVVSNTPGVRSTWPWAVAGDEGRLAIAWYQTVPGAPQDEYHVDVAAVPNALGTTVTCDDGSTATYPPVSSVTDASGRPVYKGTICTAGTICVATGGDRRLGDYFTINYDRHGALFVVTGDTTLKNAYTGGNDPVSHPLFIHATAGPSMLASAP